ncbi:MAG: oligosaccharide flippase family protein [Candidatus Omnitrophica bacterium]|nr:oligosaccharide flippase family protein [Candidatus Omnitrophota bacterium]
MTEFGASPQPRLFHQILRTSGLSLLGKVGAKILGLGHYIVLFFFVLRAEGYGQFGFILAYVGIFAGLAEGGVTSIFIRQYQDSDDRANGRAFAAAILLLALQGIVFWVLCVVCLVGLPWLNDLPERNIALMFSTLILFAPSSVCEGSFRARFELRTPVLTNLVGYAAFFLAILPGSPIDTLPEIVAVWWIVAVARMGWVALCAFRRLPPDFREGTVEVPALLRESAPLFLTRFATYFYYRIDQVMLRMFFPEESAQLGWYLSAVKWTEAANLIPAVLMEGIYPALSRVYRESVPAFGRSVQRVWRVFVASAGLTVLGLSLVFLFFLQFHFASDLVPARIPLLVLSANEGIVFLNLLLFQTLIAAGFQSRLIRVTTTMVLANVLLNGLFFTTIFSDTGHVGAATSTLLTETVGLLFQVFLIRRLLPGILDGQALRHLLLAMAIVAPVLILRVFFPSAETLGWTCHLAALAVWSVYSTFLVWGEFGNLRELMAKSKEAS